jgi:hypothetical protein
MDPYLENPAFWSDFHARFINYWCEAVADHLPDNYEARIDERVNLVEVQPEKIRRFEPDVAITQGPRSPGGAPAASGVATLEPLVVPLLIEEETRETYIQVLHRRDRTEEYERLTGYDTGPWTDEERDLLRAEAVEALGWEGVEAYQDDQP